MIDIRQLTISSHVSVDDKRAKVVGIRATSSMSGLPIVQYTTKGVVRFGELLSESAGIEPIPLTTELLEELGFEDCSKKRWHTQNWEKRFGDGLYVSFSAIGDGRYWRVQHSNKTMECGNSVCRYIHEAEAFLALHGVELIKD